MISLADLALPPQSEAEKQKSAEAFLEKQRVEFEKRKESARKMLEESLDRIAQEKQNHEQMLVRAHLTALTTHESNNLLTLTESVEFKTNDVEYSGLLNIPSKVDTWFEVIDDTTIELYQKLGKMPRARQVWTSLFENLVPGYGISSDGSGKKRSIYLDGENKLTRSAFDTRWSNYTSKTPDKGQ
jgi:hypothetical protein